MKELDDVGKVKTVKHFLRVCFIRGQDIKSGKAQHGSKVFPPAFPARP
jgi:hypothetical protein